MKDRLIGAITDPESVAEWELLSVQTAAKMIDQLKAAVRGVQ
jgi:hypothetical protein